VKPDNFDFISNFSTLWQVFLGALLATAGGLAATQIEWRFERRRRAQYAAEFFGEVLTTLQYIMEVAHETHGRGEPFGPITMRMLHSAHREITVYDKNRETLFGITDSKLRTRIHGLMLRLNAPLEGIIDVSAEITAVENQLKSPNFPDSHRADAEARLVRLHQNRDGGYEFAMEMAAEIAGTLKALEPLAGRTFEGLKRVEGTI
jgi:hypothetical protein